MNENEHTEFNPDYYIPPGETLEETLEALNITPSQLAEQIGENLAVVNKLLIGEGHLTPNIAEKLEKTIGVPASYWNRHERRWREYLARQQADSVA